MDKHSTQANHSEQNYFGGTRLTLFVYRIRTHTLDAGVHFTRITNMPTYAIFGQVSSTVDYLRSNTPNTIGQNF